MKERHLPVEILVDQRIGGTGHRLADPQPPGETAGKGRLPGAQVAEIGHHVPGLEAGGQAGAQGFGFLRAVGMLYHTLPLFYEILPL